MQQKEALLDQIRTLDFDHETGKIPDDLHQAQRAQLVAAAAEALQQLDALQGSGAAGSGGFDDDMEAAIARARRRRETGASDKEIEAVIAQARQKRPSTPTSAANGHPNFCPQCGSRVDASDKFCAACGHKLIPVKAVK